MSAIDIKKLSYSCGDKESAKSAAKYLLGKYLCASKEGRIKRWCITEAEVYTDDEEFCYGKRKDEKEEVTKLFMSVGKWCVFNGMIMISCGTDSGCDNILIRGTDCIKGPCTIKESTLGTGKNSNKLNNNNERDIIRRSRIWLEDRGVLVNENDIVSLTRVKIPDKDKLRFKTKVLTYPFK